MKKYCRCRISAGYILISVLISTSLLLTMATAFAWYARNVLAQAYSAELAAETRSVAGTALAAVKAKIASDTNKYDSFSEKLYSGTEPLTARIGKYRAEIYVEPLDSLIPLKGIFLGDGSTIKSEFQEPWNSAWEESGLPDTAPAAADFIDTDTVQRGGGYEDESCINRVPLDVSELLSVNGMGIGELWGDGDKRRGISDYFTVFGSDKININTAPAYLIPLLDRRIDAAAAESLACYRLSHPIEKPGDLAMVPGFPAAATANISNAIKFSSSYFRITISVTGDSGGKRNFRITVKRDGKAVRTVRWEE